MSLIIENAGKTYCKGESATVAVEGCSIAIGDNQFCAIVGHRAAVNPHC